MSLPKNSNLLEDEEGERGGYGTSDSMDPELYRATTQGDILEFVRAMERGPGGPLSAGCVQLGPQKDTVLHIATSLKHYEIVKLVCKDLPFFAAEKNAKGDTALHIASRAGDSLLVSLLLSSDCIESVLGEKNEEGNTALHEALRYGREDVARILMGKNMNMLYGVDKEGKSLLYLAAEAGYVGIVRLLLENPVGNYSVGGRLKHKSPVHAAILGRNIDVLKLLWKKDQSSFQFRCDQGGNPIHYASSAGYLQGVSFLLKKHSPFAYQRNKHGLFPIHIASSKGHIAIIQEMLRQCPDSKDLLTSHGENLIHIAAKSGRSAKALMCGVLKMDELDKLVNEGDGDGNTPLHVATIHGNAMIVSILMSNEKVNSRLENNDGYTALDMAEECMEAMGSLKQRLTWTALKLAGAPRAQNQKALGSRKSILHEQYKMENYRDKVNVILLVATLIASMTFTAGFTVPGGYSNFSQDQGTATMLQKVKFHEFVICDCIAMYSSIIVVVTLIWAQLSDFRSIRTALNLAIPLLGLALGMMCIAFTAGLYLAVSKLRWLGNFVLLIGLNFTITLVVLFALLCISGSSRFCIIHRVAYYMFRLVLYAIRCYIEDDEEK